MAHTRIVILAGSLRKGSLNRLLAENNVRLAPEGVEMEHFLLDGLPNFDQDLENDPPQVVVNLKRKVSEADGVILVTPEYNYSYSSVTKSAIDWASRPYGQGVWTGKPVAIQSASMGYMGGSRAQYHLRQVLGFFPAKQLYHPEVFLSSAHEKFDANGILTDEFTVKNIQKQHAALLDLIRG